MKPSNLPTSALTPNGLSNDPSAPMLSLDDVHTYIGQFHILQGISMQVRRGAATVLLGRNGAGKTTTLKTIMGLIPPAMVQLPSMEQNWTEKSPTSWHGVVLATCQKIAEFFAI